MTSNDDMSGAGSEHDDAELVAALRRFGATLRGNAVWEEPPADLADRISTSITSMVTDTDRPDGAPPVSLDTVRRRRRSWLRPGLAVAASAVLAFAAGVLIAGGDDDRDGDRDAFADVMLAATERSPDAEATGDIVDQGAGYAIRLDVVGLPPAPEGTFYEGWLCDEDRTDWVSVGTFHMRGGDGVVVLWAGVPIADYPRLVVTTQDEGGTGGYRGDVVLEGRFTTP